MQRDMAKDYAAAMDSVRLIEKLRTSPPAEMSADEIADAIDRNVEHLRIVVAREWTDDFDLAPLTAAIDA